MERFLNRTGQTPDWLTPTRARLLAGLATFIIVLGAMGVGLADSRTALVRSIGLIVLGLGDLALGLGGFLPENRGGKVARMAFAPLFVLWVVALIAWLALEVVGRI